jgi:hypothetical protein
MNSSISQERRKGREKITCSLSLSPQSKKVIEINECLPNKLAIDFDTLEIKLRFMCSLSLSRSPIIYDCFLLPFVEGSCLPFRERE